MILTSSHRSVSTEASTLLSFSTVVSGRSNADRAQFPEGYVRRVVVLIAFTVASLFAQAGVARASSLTLSSNAFADALLSAASSNFSAEFSSIANPAADLGADSATTAAAALNSQAKTYLSAPNQAVGAAYSNLTINPGSICIAGICFSWPPIVITPQPPKSVPEPATLALIGLGLAAVFASRHRQRRVV